MGMTILQGFSARFSEHEHAIDFKSSQQGRGGSTYLVPKLGSHTVPYPEYPPTLVIKFGRENGDIGLWEWPDCHTAQVVTYWVYEYAYEVW